MLLQYLLQQPIFCSLYVGLYSQSSTPVFFLSPCSEDCNDARAPFGDDSNNSILSYHSSNMQQATSINSQSNFLCEYRSIYFFTYLYFHFEPKELLGLQSSVQMPGFISTIDSLQKSNQYQHLMYQILARFGFALSVNIIFYTQYKTLNNNQCFTPNKLVTTLLGIR